jgi:tetratricopeptide (TPR) repeat protein
MECYVNASRLAPKDFRWIYLLAKLNQREGRIEDAIKQFTEARKLRPEYVAVLVNLGHIYLQLDRREDAKASYQQALKLDESAAAEYGLGQLELSSKNYSEAAKYFEKALSLTPEANRIHYSLAMAYRGLGDAEKAKAHLARQGPVGARVADPLVDGLQELIRGERVHLIRGKLAADSRRFAEAASEFRKAIVANPESVPAHVNLGAVLTQTGDLEGAIEQFEAALRIDPKNTNAHYNLAVLLANDNKHEPAILHLQSVLSVYPNDLGAGFLFVQELAELGRCSEAADWVRKMIVAAERERKTELLARLKRDLLLYERSQPCRRTGEAPQRDQLFQQKQPD